uniref:YkvA family protein n=1 Tax=Alistipes megaguti TaxID=2364787 RepID=UPI000EFA9938|nr:YkvA family protein [Alistipes megaguti]
MKEMKRNPIGYRTVTRMEEESASRNEEQAQAENSTTASEQAAQNHFEAGGWQHEAEETVNDRERMEDLGNKRDEFTRKKGLSRVKQQLVLLWDYLSAVTSGRYKGYSMWAYLKVVACLLYVVSPFDLVPDFFPWVGWLDDIAVVIYVCGLVKEELDQFSVWQARQHLSTEY